MIEQKEIERLRRHLRAIIAKADDPDALAAVTALTREFVEILAAQGRALHDRGYSWQDIAAPLRISRQAAYQRYAFVPDMVVTPIGYQGAAQHTYTAGCDGFHEPGQCPRQETAPRIAEVETGAPWRSSAEAEWDGTRD